MKKISFLSFFLFAALSAESQGFDLQNGKALGSTYVEMQTSYGKIVILLYDDTPLHRDNFIKLVNNGVGSFVPADSARISVVDKIFTRVGASDDLTAGQSTFMVEMSEVSDILKNATPNSLVILDEVGRGTSTFDGVSIARAVAEFICNSKKLGCKTLFATHYHELIGLENELEGVKNYSIAVNKHGGTIRFLRKIVRGGVDESYGVDVAKLAGLPAKVVARARELLEEMEKAHGNERPVVKNDDFGQISFGSLGREAALDMLEKTNIDELSDSECRELLKDMLAALQ